MGSSLIFNCTIGASILDVGDAEHGEEKTKVDFLVVNQFKRGGDGG